MYNVTYGSTAMPRPSELPLSTVNLRPRSFSQPRIKPSKRLNLNVGGTHYEVSKSLVDMYPDTLLGSREKECFYDDARKEYVFDRDPDIFRHILNYYRTGTLHYPENEGLVKYEEELSFFGLDCSDLEEMLGPCCREVYFDKKETLIKVNSRNEDENISDQDRTLRERLWLSIENPGRDACGTSFFYVMLFFITVSIASNVLETIYCRGVGREEWMYCGDRYPRSFYVVESACAILFTLEYIIRFYSTPERWIFVKSPMSIIDILSILPFYIALCMPKDSEMNGVFVTLRVFRVFRVFKLTRSSTNLQLLGYTLRSCVRDLSFLLFALFMTVIVFSTVIFYAEKGTPASHFTSIPATSWYIIVTMTTLGYGDMVARTTFGKVVTAFCCLSSVVLLTLPVTVIVSNFNNLYRPDRLKSKFTAIPAVRRRSITKTPNDSDLFESQHRHLLESLDQVRDRRLGGVSFVYDPRSDNKGEIETLKIQSESESDSDNCDYEYKSLKR
ncbi:PREDICTED: potassium voltage-gated channel protein Shal-like [Branchiostoma belcheri]|uniref:Potassium voltage-gated channel protein Shal-like n=1 Tax=Branchiostoma belcheri TaxID=7741 RepID=A0A6P4YM68_BRABE|nr:PREDICTED: potassium voltage-gated channel protein Shal-like [Branchiostoma belcheri]